MSKAKTYIKGCILASTISMLYDIYKYYVTANETFVTLSIFAGSALACSLVVWKDLKNTDEKY